MPKLVDLEERRSAFVTASWDVIAAEGLDGATLKRVAAAAGCTTGSLTHYFDSRATLLVDALRTAHYQAGARMLRAAQGADSAGERLRAVLLEALPLDDVTLREWKVWIAFWGASATDAALSTENARRYREWSTFLERILEPFGAEAEADDLVAFVDGLGLRIALTADPRERVEAQSRCRRQIEKAAARFTEGPS